MQANVEPAYVGMAPCFMSYASAELVCPANVVISEAMVAGTAEKKLVFFCLRGGQVLKFLIQKDLRVEFLLRE
jgi:hypothetical protein